MKEANRGFYVSRLARLGIEVGGNHRFQYGVGRMSNRCAFPIFL